MKRYIVLLRNYRRFFISISSSEITYIWQTKGLVGLMNDKEFTSSEEDLNEYEVLNVWVDLNFMNLQKKVDKSD